MGRFGVTEVVILLGIALLLFVGGRVAEGGGMRSGARQLRKSLREDEPAPPSEPSPEAAPAPPPAPATPSPDPEP